MEDLKEKSTTQIFNTWIMIQILTQIDDIHVYSFRHKKYEKDSKNTHKSLSEKFSLQNQIIWVCQK